MFITLQFPLFDYRFFEADPKRKETPKWPEPGKKDRVRYFGDILDRNKPYLGPWDDEKKYCSAGSVFNFCGLGNDHFFKSLYSDPHHARILFRRFQSDGKCMAKFEVGVNGRLADDLPGQPPPTVSLPVSIVKHIQKYLLCPVKIKIGNQLTQYLSLVDAGEKLRDAYYWTTTKEKKSFNAKDVKRRVEPCEPALLVQLTAGEIDSESLPAKKVDMPFLAEAGIQLFYGHIPYTIAGRKYQLKTWFIITPADVSANPLYSGEFHGYDQTVRYLRINLLRIHLETCMQKKLIETFGSTEETYQVKSPAVRDRLYFYLHKILLNLTNIQRNTLPQEKLVEAAFRLDEFYDGSLRIEDQIKVLEEYKNWLKQLDVTPKNEQVLNYLEKSADALQQQQKNETALIIVFISYNHADKDTAALLKEKLEKEKITVILDSASMQAGTSINDFISKSVLKAHVILSVVSENSLTSGWVAVETVNAIFIKDFFPDKKFVPCFLDTGFMTDGFIDKANIKIDARLSAIKDLAKSRSGKEMRSPDIDEEWKRLESLRLKLPDIITRLKNDLSINIGAENLDINFPKIIDVIKN
jgi:hypothetical protein